jgi:hypothetical protein
MSRAALELQTTQALERAVAQYEADLLAEAQRLEAAQNTSGSAQVTATNVTDAALILRRGYRRPRKPRWVIAVQLVSTLGGFIAGLFADAETLKAPHMMVIFLVIVTITLLSTILALLRE